MPSIAAKLAPCIRMLTGGGLVAFEADEALNETSFAAGTDGENRVFCPVSEPEAAYAFLTAHLPPGAAAVGVAGLGAYRAAPPRPGGRLAGRIAVVTGAAQGFGKGLAGHMAAEGASLVVADLNLPLAERTAAALRERFGPDAARALPVDVSDEGSVEALVERTALLYGGLDLMVSNAGVLRAGGLDELDQKAFEFVTRVNYTGYFLCAKYAAEVMRLQRRFAPAHTMDIVQINSKSGLEGSNKNFAYAGGKFGGIGLTQSFAKELVGDGIKVNSICPGNFLDGPLWRDPEKGLFVQYLRAGKVPGARTAEDVRRAYEARVPMNRGCEPLDVARALFYCVEQQYETGQAIPVTGGQNMLR